MAKPKKPQPEVRISRSEAERITGWSSRALKRMATEGFLKAPTYQGYEVMDLLAGTNLWARRGGDGDVKAEMAKEKLLKLKADRERAEHELAISKREMIPAEEIESRGAKCAQAFAVSCSFCFVTDSRPPAQAWTRDSCAGSCRSISGGFVVKCKRRLEVSYENLNRTQQG